ncbi:MAG: flagellar brake protein [Nitrospirota bacterium]
MEDVGKILERVIAERIPCDLLFDGQGVSCTGRLSGARRVQDVESLVLDVMSGDAPRSASVVRVRVVIDKVLHEFASVVVRRQSDPLPVFLIRYPTEVHQVDRRVHHRVEVAPEVRLRVAMVLSGSWLAAEVHNLSQGGVAFSSPHVTGFAVGHTVPRVELTFDDQKPIVTSGVVRNIFTIRYPREVGPVYGVQWERLTPEESSRLAAYVLRRRTKPA